MGPSGGGAAAAAGAAEGAGARVGERMEVNISLRQNLIWLVFASVVSEGFDSTAAISFLMTAAEPKAAVAAKVAGAAAGGGAGDASRERTARVRVLKRKGFPVASVRCCQSEEVGGGGGCDMMCCVA
jgi:hypothetical protein